MSFVHPVARFVAFLLFALCLVSVSAHAEESLTGSEKMRYYGAGALTTMIPGGFGIGHYIDGNSEKGHFFFLTQGGLLMATSFLWVSCPKGRPDVLIDPKCPGSTRSLIDGASAIFVGVWLWQIYDVWWNGKAYISSPTPEPVSVGWDPERGLLLAFRF